MKTMFREVVTSLARKYCDYDIISITEVGSRMWKMEELSSDHDIEAIFVYPTREIMRGHQPKSTLKMRSLQVNNTEYDIQYLEVAHLVDLLIKGNINAIWAVTSPISYLERPIFTKLKKFVKYNPAKSIYPSCRGMAISQWNDVKKRREVRSPIKSKLTAMRTLQFGLNYLLKGECQYIPFKHDEALDVMDFKVALQALEHAREESTLPAICPEEILRDILEDIRVKGL